MISPQPSPARVGLGRWIVSGLGIGYMPFASGSFGSAVAVAIALAVWGGFKIFEADLYLLNIAWALLTLLASAACVYWGPWAIECLGPMCRKKDDPGIVVIDEFAGQWLALIGLPMATTSQALTVLAVQFFWFRLFDVVKPPPSRQFERLPFGWGILCDDLAAAVYANILGQVIFRLVL